MYSQHFSARVLHSFSALVCLTFLACSKPDPPPDPEPFAEEVSSPYARPSKRVYPSDRPNLVWIVLDACRADRLSYTGYERQTSPNMDRLASQGAVFLNHHTQGLWTELSVPSYMTGRYFPVACVDVLRTYPLRNPPEGERLFPLVAAANGYQTACFSAHAWILPDSPLGVSFQEFNLIRPEPGKPLHAAEFSTINKHVLPWLETRTPDQPFFLYLHSLDTHFPHLLDPPHDRWMDSLSPSDAISNGIPLENFGMKFTEEDADLMSAMHDGSIHYVDAQIQRVVDALDNLGLRENTVIVISSDHGDALGEDGSTWGHWESSDTITRVPLLIAGPGVPSGSRIESITENVDIVPTLVDLLRLDDPTLLTDGKSLAPLMHDPTRTPLRTFALTKSFHHEYDGAQGFILRGNDFKYEFDGGHQREHLWKLPDDAGNRIDLIATYPEKAKAYREMMETQIYPLWAAYQALPKDAFEVSLTPGTFVDDHAVVYLEDHAAVTDEHLTDGKWHFQDGALWHAGWQEDVPPISVHVPVPPGRYIVQLRVLSTRDYQGHPASSFHVQLPDDETFDIAMTPVDYNAFGYEYRDVSEFVIEDGAFTFTLDNGDPAYWGAIKSVRFVTPYRGEPVLSAEELEERIEQLKSLGYLE